MCIRDRCNTGSPFHSMLTQVSCGCVPYSLCLHLHCARVIEKIVSNNYLPEIDTIPHITRVLTGKPGTRDWAWRTHPPSSVHSRTLWSPIVRGGMKRVSLSLPYIAATFAPSKPWHAVWTPNGNHSSKTSQECETCWQHVISSRFQYGRGLAPLIVYK